MTRQEYMAPFISKQESTERHQRYYAQYVSPEVTALVARHIGAERVRLSLCECVDQHFNDIPLRRWDRLVPSLPHTVGAQLKANGDYLTLAGGVCILKEAARQLALKETP